MDTSSTRYPIKIQLRNGINRHHIYDVNGVLLTDETGKPLNIWNPKIKEAFDTKRLRLHYAPKYGIRYFTTCTLDFELFQYERRHGTLYYQKLYHCYYDDDVDVDFFKRMNIELLPPTY
jgi:hypothetical protein